MYELGDYTTRAQTQLSRVRFTALAYPDSWHILIPHTIPPFFADYGKLFEPDNRDAAQGYGFKFLTAGIMVSYDATLVFTKTCQQVCSSGWPPISAGNLEAALFLQHWNGSDGGVTGQLSFSKNGDPVNKAIALLSFNSNKADDTAISCQWLYEQFFTSSPLQGQSCSSQ